MMILGVIVGIMIFGPLVFTLYTKGIDEADDYFK